MEKNNNSVSERWFTSEKLIRPTLSVGKDLFTFRLRILKIRLLLKTHKTTFLFIIRILLRIGMGVVLRFWGHYRECVSGEKVHRTGNDAEGC